MRPDVYQSHPLLALKAPLPFKRIPHPKYCRSMKNKLTLFVVFVLCSFSIFRFLNISMIIINNPSASSPSSTCNSLTQKEMHFLSKLISRSSPCNLLIFGLKNHYSRIASLNGGLTIFLDDIKYNTVASEAYRLLQDARQNPHCKVYQESKKCNLALTNLPREVRDTMWDVVIVDGPSGDGPDSPGRMASIYTASVLARRGNKTHVIVHDVDRMIEKWFSWEFLCQENLVSSKGRFWHFQLLGESNGTTFCTP
ncbi:hypothetical protein CASFOL_009972 [Castilleja foliolosa]|uniref:Polysaccharide biosynthesis domain-containing protein n=1 Tax=Castilleja foliolosa TaxID=1961234 RepID=A0ABD3DTH4_9LAMI